MAYRRKTRRTYRKTRGRSSYRRPVRRRTVRRRAVSRKPQVIKLVIEQANPSVAAPESVLAAREAAPKKAKF